MSKHTYICQGLNTYDMAEFLPFTVSGLQIGYVRQTFAREIEKAQVCMHVCMYICACMHACMYVCSRYMRRKFAREIEKAQVCMHLCMCIQVCMYSCMHVCMCACTHVYVYAPDM